jgi:hypothetical protein
VKRLTLICAATTCLVAVAFPAAGGAVPGERGNSAIAKACAAEKKADKAAFRAKYGRHAMRQCIKGAVVAADPAVVPTEATNAAQSCAEQRDADEAAFTAQWGTNTEHANSHGAAQNAYGQCVSSTAHSSHGGGPPA